MAFNEEDVLNQKYDLPVGPIEEEVKSDSQEENRVNGLKIPRDQITKQAPVSMDVDPPVKPANSASNLNVEEQKEPVRQASEDVEMVD